MVGAFPSSLLPSYWCRFPSFRWIFDPQPSSILLRWGYCIATLGVGISSLSHGTPSLSLSLVPFSFLSSFVKCRRSEWHSLLQILHWTLLANAGHMILWEVAEILPPLVNPVFSLSDSHLRCPSWKQAENLFWMRQSLKQLISAANERKNVFRWDKSKRDVI